MMPYKYFRKAPNLAALNLDPTKVLDHLWGSSLVGLTFVDSDGRWVNPSPALCELLEYTAAELESMTYMEVTHPQDVHSDNTMSKAVLQRDIPYYIMTKRYITKSGKTVWIKLHVSAFFDESGKFTLFLSQIAPAEVFNPKAPVVVKRKPIETRIKEFITTHWKWLIPATITTIGVIWKGYSTWQQLVLLLNADK